MLVYNYVAKLSSLVMNNRNGLRLKKRRSTREHECVHGIVCEPVCVSVCE